jgi:tRNA threonylcarbamoyladenosine biosynthesis protein TsaB
MNRLAIETSTEQLSVAVMARGQVWSHQGPGGAQASAGLLAAVHAVLAQAGLALNDMDVIAMGRGPGSFTGLRTACAVSQGLAFGLGVGIVPIDTLLALAEEGRHQCATARPPEMAGAENAAHNQPANPHDRALPQGAGVTRFYAVIDARMGQLYTAAYEHRAGLWHTVQAPAVQNPADCALPQAWSGQPVWAVGLTPDLLPGMALPWVAASPTASALLRLTDQALADGAEVPPALALPLYLRDKVAQTTAERALAKANAAAT